MAAKIATALGCLAVGVLLLPVTYVVHWVTGISLDWAPFVAVGLVVVAGWIWAFVDWRKTRHLRTENCPTCGLLLYDTPAPEGHKALCPSCRTGG